MWLLTGCTRACNRALRSSRAHEFVRLNSTTAETSQLPSGVSPAEEVLCSHFSLFCIITASSSLHSSELLINNASQQHNNNNMSATTILQNGGVTIKEPPPFQTNNNNQSNNPNNNNNHHIRTQSQHSAANDVLKLFSDTQPLDAIFRPKSVALVGASEKPGSVGRTVLWNLL